MHKADVLFFLVRSHMFLKILFSHEHFITIAKITDKSFGLDLKKISQKILNLHEQ
jgi:hypothetical protein